MRVKITLDQLASLFDTIDDLRTALESGNVVEVIKVGDRIVSDVRYIQNTQEVEDL
jgi:hypothetical protein